MKLIFELNRSRPTVGLKAPRTMMGAVALELLKNNMATIDNGAGIVRPIVGISVARGVSNSGWKAAVDRFLGRPDKRYEGHRPCNPKNSKVSICVSDQMPDSVAVKAKLQGIFSTWPTITITDARSTPGCVVGSPPPTP